MASLRCALLFCCLLVQVAARWPAAQCAPAAQGAGCDGAPGAPVEDDAVVADEMALPVKLLQTARTLKRQDSHPPRPRPHVGVLLGYDRPGLVKPGSWGAISLRLARHWAGLRNYSLFVEPRLGSLSSTPEAAVWGKIAAMQRYLPQVDVLFWLDLDVVVLDPSRTAEELMRRDRGSCVRTGQAEDDAVLASQGEDMFLWAATAEFSHSDSGVFKHGKPDFPLKLCAGALALTNDPRSFRFLDEVWGHRHVRSWPAEQGAMWDTLLSNPDLLSRTCVLSEDVFVYESLEIPQAALARPGPFALHMTGYKDAGLGAEEKRSALARAACDRVFSSLGGCPEPAPAEL